MLNNTSSILVQNNRLKQHSLKQKIKKIVLPISFSLFLSACTNLNFFENEVTNSLKYEAYSSSEFYVRKIETTTDQETKESYRLLAIRKLLQENKLTEAKYMFKKLSKELNDTQLLEYHLLMAKLNVMENKFSQANTLLTKLLMEKLSSSQLKRYYNIAIVISKNKKNTLNALQKSIELEKYLTSAQEKQENNDNIWALLRRTNNQRLTQMKGQQNDYNLMGWLNLIHIYNNYKSQPQVLIQRINEWKTNYSDHSATHYLPNELKTILSFEKTQLNHIALLLPLSGDYKFLGDIIYRGFNDASKLNNNIIVDVLDSNSASIDDLIQQSKMTGAQAIVGPLLKFNVDNMLNRSDTLGLSVLALNTTNNARSKTNICYYGLAPETEAQSAANKIYNDHYTSVTVIAPNNDFGQRSANAFTSQWRKLTNDDANVQYYTQAIEIVAKLQNSNSNALYFLGNADQLLEAKEALDGSELANRFAIYSSSRSHSPNSQGDFFAAMEGVKFSEIPLLSDRFSEEFKKVNQLTNSDYSMMRLYAMGADAWKIINNFNELRQIPDFTLNGLTGKLNTGVNCHIERGMTWLKYSNSQIIQE